ncbi:MAG: hypothetical protein H0V31_04545 [Acidobacteria bacterium]|nr:hypothetical protein [Acidobacteriota bacterium]
MNQNSFQLPDVDFAASKPNTNTILSELPKLPPRRPFNLDGAAFPKSAIACVNCKTNLASETDYLQSIRACRKCLGVYAVVLGAIEESEQRRRRETLERFAAEVKR